MTLRIDREAQTIEASVSDLVALEPDSAGSIGIISQARLELGRRVHQRVQAARQTALPDYRCEVELRGELTVDGFTLRLQGRIDGLYQDAEAIWVDEIKSVTLAAEQLANMTAANFRDYSLQAALYARLLADQSPQREIRTTLILVSLIDESTHWFPVLFQPEQIRQAIGDRIRLLLREADLLHQRKVRRGATQAALVFPFSEPRPHQTLLMNEIAEGLKHHRPALIMAPTGIGKTISALIPALKHALQHDATLFFLSARKTQQLAIEATFDLLALRSGLTNDQITALTLRAKEQMCPPGTLMCHPDLCPFLADFSPRLARSRLVETLLAAGTRVTPETLYAAGEQHRLCPFALSLALTPHADLVIADYNYVFDPTVALQLFFDSGAKEKAVVVIDEAHNLFDRARGYYSPSITMTELGQLILQNERGEFKVKRDRSPQQELLSGVINARLLFDEIGAFLLDLKNHLRDQLTSAAADGMMPGADGCVALTFSSVAWEAFAQTANQFLLRYLFYRQLHREPMVKDPLVDLFKRIVRIKDIVLEAAPEFVGYGKLLPEALAIGIICVNPARPLSRQHQRRVGTVAISATLAPLPYYADVLGFQAQNPLLLSVPSPFPREHLWVGIIPTVTTRFAERDHHLPAIAAVIRELVALRRGKYIAFFPSFRFLSDCVAAYRPIAERSIELLLQLPGLSRDQQFSLLDRFRQHDGPVVLMAVMGGVFAEGIDLPGDTLIGAIIVGPGLPQVGFERSAMQHYFQEVYHAGFEYGMLYPGMQRVIQAAGRVIRTPNDRGMIALLDERFMKSPYCDAFPAHWYRYSPAELVDPDWSGSLRTFWGEVV